MKPVHDRPRVLRSGGIHLKSLALALAVALALIGAPAAHAAASSVPIVAAGFSFLSPVVVVPLGTAVTWMAAALPHTVTTTDASPVGDGSANDPSNGDANPDTFSVQLPQGSSFTHTFATAGVFNYHCELHHRLGMIGTVVVVDPTALP